MDAGFTRFLEGSPVPIEGPLHSVRPGEPTGPAPAAPAGAPEVRQPFVNESLNSRLATVLGSRRTFDLRWKADLPPELRPQWVLEAQERVAVLGQSDWRLFDSAGAFLRQGVVHLGGVTLDPERSVFFVPEFSGLLAARRLQSGEPAFHVSLLSGKEFFRTFVARRGLRLVSVSTEMPLDMSLPDPESSLVEIVDLGDPANPRSYDQEGAPEVVADLHRQTRTLLAAMSGDSLVLATEDRVYFADLDLKFRAALSDSFLPLALSLDERGRIYLLVQTQGQTRLWLLAESGERSFSFTLPTGPTRAHPPIVGYDQTAYLLAGEHIFAIAPDGKLDWSRAAAGALAGAVVTADGFLLVSEGGEVAAYDPEGERRVLFSSPGEPLTTPPILTANGDLLVASSAALYCLTPREAPAPEP